MWLLPLDALRDKDLTGTLVPIMQKKTRHGLQLASSFLLRLGRQHKQLALEFSELSNIA
jgi:hypothetical protein